VKLLLLLLLTSDPRTVEVFKDRGDFFIRAGTSRGLRVGVEVTILGDRIGDTDERRSAGKATVLEVWESLARISPDQESLKLKEVKLARLGGPAPVEAAAPSLPRPPPTPPPAAPPTARPMLKGHATIGGIAHLVRFTIFNDSNVVWTNCELRLANNKHYWLGTLRDHDFEGVMITRFTQDGTELDRELDWIWVRCAEGESRFNFSL
jgi:hypothetical protein